MKKSEIKKILKENIADWLKERNIPEADSGDMAYTKTAKVKTKNRRSNW
jgi:hypothetical protein